MLFGSVLAGRRGWGRGENAKLRNGEGHLSENAAGIAVGRLEAFLIGNRVFACRNQILTGTNETNDREDSERDGEITSAAFGAKLSRETGDNGERNVVAGTNATASAFFVHDLNTENDGINHLNNGGGKTAARGAGLGERAKACVFGIASENVDRALTAVKHDVLVKHRHTVKLLRTAAADAGLKGHTNEITDRDRMKAAVELYRIDADRGPNYLGFLGANGAGAGDYVVAESGEENANVFKAIAVAAGVEYTVGLDADALARGRGAGESAICHKNTSLIDMNRILRPTRDLFSLIYYAARREMTPINLNKVENGSVGVAI